MTSLAQSPRVRDFRDLVIEDQAAQLHDALTDLETFKKILSEALTIVATLTATNARQREQIAALRAVTAPLLNNRQAAA